MYGSFENYSDVEQSLLRMTSQLVHFENDRVTDLEYALRIEPGTLCFPLNRR